MPYDFFMSYRHKLHRSRALEMKRLMAERGFTVWLDAEQLPETLSGTQLAEHLRQAMDSCRHVIFFEAHAEQVAQVGGPSKRRYSWHERELGMANLDRIVVLYESDEKLAFGRSATSHAYADLQDAAAQIERAVRSGVLPA